MRNLDHYEYSMAYIQERYSKAYNDLQSNPVQNDELVLDLLHRMCEERIFHNPLDKMHPMTKYAICMGVKTYLTRAEQGKTDPTGHVSRDPLVRYHLDSLMDSLATENWHPWALFTKQQVSQEGLIPCTEVVSTTLTVWLPEFPLFEYGASVVLNSDTQTLCIMAKTEVTMSRARTGEYLYDDSGIWRIHPNALFRASYILGVEGVLRLLEGDN